jgi:hypothetical protein
MVSEQVRRTTADARTKPDRALGKKKFWRRIFGFQEGNAATAQKILARKSDRSINTLIDD